MKHMIAAMLLAVASTTFGARTLMKPVDTNAWTNAPMGIFITDVTSCKDGISVNFVTDVPPPYRVGVHLPHEVGLVRARPVAYTDTWTTNAFVYGKFDDVAVFVQVYKIDRHIVPSFTRKMTQLEWERYVKQVHRHPTLVANRVDYYEDPKDMDINGIDPAHMSVIADGTWCGFIYTNATDLTYCLEMVNKQDPGSTEYKFNTNTVCLAVHGRDPNKGKGFRILAFPDQEPMEFQAQCAYSAKTNMSQEVLIKRGWKSLSSNGEWKFTTDWEGNAIMVPCTNAEPYRIYGEGL